MFVLAKSFYNSFIAQMIDNWDLNYNIICRLVEHSLFPMDW